jgi:hypothetical protein
MGSHNSTVAKQPNQINSNSLNRTKYSNEEIHNRIQNVLMRNHSGGNRDMSAVSETLNWADTPAAFAQQTSNHSKYQLPRTNNNLYLNSSNQYQMGGNDPNRKVFEPRRKRYEQYEQTNNMTGGSVNNESYTDMSELSELAKIKSFIENDIRSKRNAVNKTQAGGCDCAEETNVNQNGGKKDNKKDNKKDKKNKRRSKDSSSSSSLSSSSSDLSSSSDSDSSSSSESAMTDDTTRHAEGSYEYSISSHSGVNSSEINIVPFYSSESSEINHLQTKKRFSK